MTTLRQLTPSESLFIGGETPSVYQHTAALVMLDASAVPGYGFDTFRRHMERHIPRVPQFRWKLHEVPLALDLPYWVEDADFDLDYHIRRVAVPSPGDNQALSELVSWLYCRHLDRRKPLWEIWFIEGLSGGRFAFLQKFHHCMMDGQAATRLTEVMWDLEPDGELAALAPEIANATAGEVPELWQQSLNAAVHLSRMPLNITGEVCDALRHSLSNLRPGKPKGKPRAAAPHTSINGNISRDRGLVFSSLPLADIKAIKQRFGVTINDALLAIVGGGLREYLLAREGLPEQSLRTSMAVSLRTRSDEGFSNRITTTSVTLATDQADPLERLRTISEEAAKVISVAHHGGKGVLEFIRLFPPLMVNALIHLTPADRIPALMGVNLIVSNIRGSDRPMYVGGARAEAIYPMSIISPGGGLNITSLSYAGGMHMGLTIAPELVPEPWMLVERIEAALGEYKALAGRGRRKKAAPRKKATAKARPKARPKTARKTA